jgi:hypothetical protein
MTKRAAPLAFILAALTALTACGGGDDSGRSNADVDRVTEAIAAGDSQALADLMQYTQVACTTDEPAPGGPPSCRAGEEAGTPVDVVQASDCDSTYLRPGDVPNALQHFLNSSPEVYAAFEAPGDAPDRYEIVLSSSRQGGTLASGVVVEGGRIVLLDLGCVETPQERVAGVSPEAFVISPAEPSPTPGPS